MGRILLPHGLAAAFWNLRSDTPAMRACDGSLERFVEGYATRPRGSATLARIARHPLVTSVERFRTPHAHLVDREGLRLRAASSSYVAHEVADHEGLARALDALFDAHGSEGRFPFAYDTVAVAWTPVMG